MVCCDQCGDIQLCLQVEIMDCIVISKQWLKTNVIKDLADTQLNAVMGEKYDEG